MEKQNAKVHQLDTLRFAGFAYCSCCWLLLSFITACSSSDPVPQVKLGDQTIILELSVTQAEQERGLSGRASLPRNKGLLFVYKTAEIRGIWMPDMNFPIDVLWINNKGVVVHLERNLDPASYPKIFSSPHPSHYILELNAGVAAGVEVGSMVYFDHIPMLSELPDAG